MEGRLSRLANGSTRDDSASLRRLCERLQEAADEERRRLARLLHDSASQTLSAAAMTLSLVERESAALGPGAARALARTQELLAATCRELGELSCTLHPPLLGERGLLSALRALERRLGSARVQITVNDLPPMDGPVETTVYRITEEALTQAFAAEQAVIARLVPGRPGYVVLTLAGRPRPPKQRVLAVLALRQRTRTARGRLVVKRTASQLSIEVRLPTRRSAAVAATATGG